jgi:hypothetical protein
MAENIAMSRDFFQRASNIYQRYVFLKSTPNGARGSLLILSLIDREKLP